MPKPFITISAVLALTLLNTDVSAQKMYKCGNTYSQVPCDKTTDAIKINSDAKADPPPGLHGKELCRVMVPRAGNLKDPYSARVEAIGDPAFEIVTFANQPLTVKRYDVAMNAKNSYGAYTGIRVWSCYLTEGDNRVFKIVPPRE